MTFDRIQLIVNGGGSRLPHSQPQFPPADLPTRCGEIAPHHDVKTLRLGIRLHQRITDNLSIWIGK